MVFLDHLKEKNRLEDHPSMFWVIKKKQIEHQSSNHLIQYNPVFVQDSDPFIHRIGIIEFHPLAKSAEDMAEYAEWNIQSLASKSK